MRGFGVDIRDDKSGDALNDASNATHLKRDTLLSSRLCWQWTPWWECTGWIRHHHITAGA